MAKQIVISRAGGPEVLVEREVEPQRVGDGEVRIAVTAAGVNFADVVGRIGNYPDAPPIPYCPGYEVAGTVTEAGRDAGIAVGTRVCALTKFGGYAEEIVTRADAVFPVPDGVELALTAGIPVTYLTAYTSLFVAGGLQPGGSVLIMGGAGGVGSAAIQLARRVEGVTIFATAGGTTKCEWMRGQGVHHPIDHSGDADVKARVLELTGGRGVDIVLDPIGGRGVQRSVQMARPLGRVVVYGVSAMSPGKKRSVRALVREGLPMRFFNLLPLFDRNVGLHPINMLHLAESDPERISDTMALILRGVVEGSLAPVIAERMALSAEGARAAHHYLQDRKNIGKVILVR